MYWDGVRWNGWYNAPFSGATSADAPAAVWSNGNSRLDVAARVGSELFQKNYGTSSNTWTGWNNLHGGITSRPALAAKAGSAYIDAFVRGTDRQLYLTHSDGGTFGAWQNKSAPWTPSAQYISDSGPAAVMWQSDNRTDVFMQGGDNKLFLTFRCFTTFSGNAACPPGSPADLGSWASLGLYYP
jgi:hypothetical protein